MFLKFSFAHFLGGKPPHPTDYHLGAPIGSCFHRSPPFEAVALRNSKDSGLPSARGSTPMPWAVKLWKLAGFKNRSTRIQMSHEMVYHNPPFNCVVKSPIFPKLGGCLIGHLDFYCFFGIDSFLVWRENKNQCHIDVYMILLCSLEYFDASLWSTFQKHVLGKSNKHTSLLLCLLNLPCFFC